LAFLKSPKAYSQFVSRTTQNFWYGQYYAMQAFYQSGEKDFQAWYPKVSQTLLSLQKKDGSWPGDQSFNTQVLSTPTAILVLGAPYRYLPIYQR
jgi:hypothetical protein